MDGWMATGVVYFCDFNFSFVKIGNRSFLCMLRLIARRILRDGLIAVISDGDRHDIFMPRH